MEDAVYLCGWQKSANGFELWLKTGPRVRAEGETFELAAERLLEAVQGARGAMVSVFEFDPPPPPSNLDAPYSRPELYRICGNDRFEIDADSGTPHARLDAFYEQPVCRRCAAPTAPRSTRPLHLTYAPSAYDGAFGTVGRGGPARVEIVSDEFLALLSAHEREHLVLRPVVRRRARRTFHEVLGPAGPPLVHVAALKAKGWRCGACGFAIWGYWVDGLSINDFVAASDLSPQLPSIFTVGTPPTVMLCVTGPRWRELVGRKGVRGFVSRPLGVVRDEEVVRRPDLRERWE